MAKAEGLRLPQWRMPTTTGGMRRWLRKINVSVDKYLADNNDRRLEMTGTSMPEAPRRGGRRRAAAPSEAAPVLPPPVGMPLQLPTTPVFTPPPIYDNGQAQAPIATSPLPPPPMPPPPPPAPFQPLVQPLPQAPATQPIPPQFQQSVAVNEPAWEDFPEPPDLDYESMRGPRIMVVLGTTANIGNYENIKYDIGLFGVPINASLEEIDAICEAGNARAEVIMDHLGARLLQRVRDVKEARGIAD
jgi:hypothetical protein